MKVKSCLILPIIAVSILLPAGEAIRRFAAKRSKRNEPHEYKRKKAKRTYGY